MTDSEKIAKFDEGYVSRLPDAKDRYHLSFDRETDPDFIDVSIKDSSGKLIHNIGVPPELHDHEFANDAFWFEYGEIAAQEYLKDKAETNA